LRLFFLFLYITENIFFISLYFWEYSFIYLFLWEYLLYLFLFLRIFFLYFWEYFLCFWEYFIQRCQRHRHYRITKKDEKTFTHFWEYFIICLYFWDYYFHFFSFLRIFFLFFYISENIFLFLYISGIFHTEVSVAPTLSHHNIRWENIYIFWEYFFIFLRISRKRCQRRQHYHIRI